MNSKNIMSAWNFSCYRCASLSFSLSLFLLLFISLLTSVSLSFHVCLSLFSCPCLSLFMTVSLSLLHALYGVCCCVCYCGGGCVCVSSCLALKKRSPVYVQNSPVCTFKTPASHWTRCVLNVPTGAFWTYTRESLSPSSRVSLLSCVSLFLSRSLSLSLLVSLCLLSALSLSLSVLNNNDNDRSSSWHSLYTRPNLALRARVRGPWPIPCPVNMFASCKELLSKDSFASLLPLGMKWACICAGKKNMLGVVCRDVSVLCVCGLLCDVVCYQYSRRCAVSCVSVGVDALAVVWWQHEGSKSL